jgi:hypothetical protein
MRMGEEIEFDLFAPILREGILDHAGALLPQSLA